jgi:Patatin-like phospholipase
MSVPGCDDLDFSERIRFDAVLRAEYDEVERRRRNAKQSSPARVNGRPPRLTGLSLSGGGIRSATFNLGVLQALAKANKLVTFDYLSTVSGGGYVGGWWSAWLARKERDLEPGETFPPPEDIVGERDDRRAQMEAEGYKGGADRQQVKDSAINAATDPIHHLRLFSNFITPRKGLLSADTWRAITTTLRNIILTQLILLPIVLAVILIGQAWFLIPLADTATPIARLVKALLLPLMLLVGSVAAVSVWIVATRRLDSWGDKIVVTVGGIAFVALTALILSTLGVSSLAIFLAAALLSVWMLYVFLRLFVFQLRRKTKWADTDYWRNRLVLLQTRFLSYAVFSAVVLLFAGFGHILFDYLLRSTTNAAAKAGGWSAFAFSLLSAAYTAYKNSPTGGADQKSNRPPGLLQRVATKVAPFLFVLAIGIFLSWVGNTLFELIHDEPWRLMIVTRGAFVAAFLFLVFAIYEFRPRQRWLTLVPLSVFWIGVIWAAQNVSYIRQHVHALSVATLFILAAVLFIRSWIRRKGWIAGYAVLLTAIGAWFWWLPSTSVPADTPILRFAVAGVLATLALLLLELVAGRDANTRCIALTVIGSSIFVLLGAAATIRSESGLHAQTVIALIAIILGWVLALGWLADPNALTIHAFYKARLVRAYLGASNPIRKEMTEADITDAVPGDDVLLTQLRNTERGAPYHLINQMLNLVGGSDIATQARHSELFFMSKHFVGSVRTGFRPTSEYACGSISLGTAVAISGAAASPQMGAQTPSAALSALMTLFNVRTGYWAPTPNLSYWRSGSTRLWPVYTLQELISQTTDLLPYCYLTDGGHYENSGAYSLIQRGCSLIVVGECGADPDTTLEDLGNLFRKVRIDFGTEITLDIDPLRNKPPTERVLVGKIRYGEKHAAELGLTEGERDATIIIIKPNLAHGEPGTVPVDVQQYGFYNDTFPQQQTFDLFYDEAQFESYRRLGQLSGEIAAKLI